MLVSVQTSSVDSVWNVQLQVNLWLRTTCLILFWVSRVWSDPVQSGLVWLQSGCSGRTQPGRGTMLMMMVVISLQQTSGGLRTLLQIQTRTTSPPPLPPPQPCRTASPLLDSETWPTSAWGPAAPTPLTPPTPTSAATPPHYMPTPTSARWPEPVAAPPRNWRWVAEHKHRPVQSSFRHTVNISVSKIRLDRELKVRFTNLDFWLDSGLDSGLSFGVVCFVSAQSWFWTYPSWCGTD